MRGEPPPLFEKGVLSYNNGDRQRTQILFVLHTSNHDRKMYLGAALAHFAGDRQRKQFDEIVFPPAEELEEVLQRMLQRVNNEQERLDSVDVTQEESTDKVAFPPEELEEVLQRMLQRMNRDQERLDSVVVTQERSCDEIGCPSDKLEEVRQRMLQQRVNDEKAGKEVDVPLKTFVGKMQEPDFVTG